MDRAKSKESVTALLSPDLITLLSNLVVQVRLQYIPAISLKQGSQFFYMTEFVPPMLKQLGRATQPSCSSARLWKYQPQGSVVKLCVHCISLADVGKESALLSLQGMALSHG